MFRYVEAALNRVNNNEINELAQSSFVGNEKLQMFMLALFKKTVIGPFFEARTGPGPDRAQGPVPGPGPPTPPTPKSPNLAPNVLGTPNIEFLVSVS